MDTKHGSAEIAGLEIAELYTDGLDNARLENGGRILATASWATLDCKQQKPTHIQY